jgi:acyl carrier protein
MPNGKVDEKALPAPDKDRSDLDNVFIAPRTPVEKLLAGIWCEIIGLKNVGISDNFFDLGGHSLMATKIMSRVWDMFLVKVPLQSLFEMPTLEGLAFALLQEAGDCNEVEKNASLLLQETERSER